MWAEDGNHGRFGLLAGERRMVHQEAELGVPAVAQQVKNLALSQRWRGFSPSPVQWVKDPALPSLWV